MTLRERFLSRLQSNGLNREQASAILKETIRQAPQLAPDYAPVRWNDSNYTETQRDALCVLLLRPVALKWIDTNLPQFPLRGLFTE